MIASWGLEVEAALKRIWLALRNVVAKGTGSRHDWKSAMTQFALLYPERFNIGIGISTRLTHGIPDTSDIYGDYMARNS